MKWYAAVPTATSTAANAMTQTKRRANRLTELGRFLLSCELSPLPVGSYRNVPTADGDSLQSSQDIVHYL